MIGMLPGRPCRAAALLLSAALLSGCTYELWGRGPGVGGNWSPGGGTSADRGREHAPIPGDGLVRVRKGDTVYGIARRYGVSMRAIIRINGLEPPYTLEIGRRLKLPERRVHVVKEGDTVYGISRQYGVDMNALARANDLGPPYIIEPGERLVIPGGRNVAAAGDERRRQQDDDREVAGVPTPRHKPAAPADATRVATTEPEPRDRPEAVPDPPARSGGRFAWPVNGKVLSDYGPKEEGRHNDGINIAANTGDPVKAAGNGVVVYAGNELRGFGNLLLVKHDGGWITAYAHNSELLVKRGDKVSRGQTIARAGHTGNVSKAQVHFEIRKGTNAVDPGRFLAQA